MTHKFATKAMQVIAREREERTKLLAKNHSRIQPYNLGLSIDLWCDGDEAEYEQVVKMTRNYNRAFQARLAYAS